MHKVTCVVTVLKSHFKSFTNQIIALAAIDCNCFEYSAYNEQNSSLFEFCVCTLTKRCTLSSVCDDNRACCLDDMCGFNAVHI